MGKSDPILVTDQKMGEGFALEWKKEGLISADFNGDLKIWRDVEKAAQSYHYDEVIEDCKWVNNDVIVTVGDDGVMNFWDLREKRIVNKVLTTNQEGKQVYCVSVNPINRNLLLTGGQTQDVKIWDTRNLNHRLHKFDGH